RGRPRRRRRGSSASGGSSQISIAQGPAGARAAYRILTGLCSENGNRILGDLRIARDDREALELGLRDQDPIERIAVVQGKGARCPCMLGGDGQRGKPPA